MSKLSLSSLHDSREIKLRNIIALEQCHYPKHNHVYSYALFLDYLIDTDKDVDLLLEKVAQMVNKLVTVIVDPGSYYDIAGEVNKSSSVYISKIGPLPCISQKIFQTRIRQCGTLSG
ncbi:hypothetical protein YC2023_076991 [Brassica napus]